MWKWGVGEGVGEGVGGGGGGGGGVWGGGGRGGGGEGGRRKGNEGSIKTRQTPFGMIHKRGDSGLTTSQSQQAKTTARKTVPPPPFPHPQSPTRAAQTSRASTGS